MKKTFCIFSSLAIALGAFAGNPGIIPPSGTPRPAAIPLGQTGTNYATARSAYFLSPAGNNSNSGLDWADTVSSLFGLASGSGNITNGILFFGPGQYPVDTTVNTFSNVTLIGTSGMSYAVSHSSQLWKLAGNVEMYNISMFDTNSAASTSVRYPLASLNTSPSVLNLTLSNSTFGGWSDVLFCQAGGTTNTIHLAATSCTFTSKWDTAFFQNYTLLPTGSNICSFTNCTFIVRGDTNFYGSLNTIGAHAFRVASWPGTYNFVNCNLVCSNGGSSGSVAEWEQGTYGFLAEGTNVTFNIFGNQTMKVGSVNGPAWLLYANSNAVINYHIPAGYALATNLWSASTNGGVINFY